ncbi:iron ABC transporter permease [Nocardioides hwasunensis]|uniref:Iron ABC transporter permease n=1 Tax=Nocardioides hwasunensis TaxID=397258 RepID=A0ABR8MI74_9ACTN|nr:iron ABC transporter permease [Nocardioides hwasunensis]
MSTTSSTGTTGSTSGSTRPAGADSLRSSRRSRVVWLLVVVGVLACVAVSSLVLGSRQVGWGDIVAGVTGHDTTIAEAAVAKRVPRTVLAMVVGAALGLAGAAMQGVTRNPLADPGILGVNMGASLAVVTGIAWFGLSGAQSFTWVAITGAAVTAVFVYAVASMGRGGPTPLKLALAGTATTAAFSSFITAVVLPRGDIADSVRSWQIGGVGGATFDRILPVVPFLVVGLLVSVVSARGLNSLALGDDVAAGLGERVAIARGSAALGAVVLCGAATALAGPIGFVGLVLPHVCRLLVGIDHRWLLPFSALTGACLLTVADVVGRVVARPGELDVGIITAIIGAPFFIYIVRRQKVRAL